MTSDSQWKLDHSSPKIVRTSRSTAAPRVARRAVRPAQTWTQRRKADMP